MSDTAALIRAMNTSAVYLLNYWAHWSGETESIPDRAIELRADTMEYLSWARPDDDANASEAGVDLVREWVSWWATTGRPEMPDALNVRTVAFLARLALVHLRASGAMPVGVAVCEVCYRVTIPTDQTNEWCVRCRVAYGMATDSTGTM